MKVLHVMADLDSAKGGPVTAVLGLAGAQAQAGHAVRVAATDRGWHGIETTFPVSIFPSGDPIWRYSRAMSRDIVALLRECEIAHLHGLWDYPILAAAGGCRDAARPYVVTLHGMLNARSLGSHRLRKRAYLRVFGDAILRGARRLHFTSEDERANAVAAGYSARSFVVPFGTDIREACGNAPAFRHRYGISADDRIVLFVGRLHPQKQPSLLIDAMPLVWRSVARARLIIVGDGEPAFIQRLNSAATKMGGSVIFTGALERKHVFDAYAACDVLVQPSAEESLGLVLLEAMACGKPVLVTPGVGIARAIGDAGAGRVIAAGPAEIGRAIVAVLQDDAARVRMGTNARRLVERQFSWTRVVDAIDHEYGAALLDRASIAL